MNIFIWFCAHYNREIVTVSLVMTSFAINAFGLFGIPTFSVNEIQQELKQLCAYLLNILTAAGKLEKNYIIPLLYFPHHIFGPLVPQKNQYNSFLVTQCF